MSYVKWNEFIILLENRHIDLKSEKAYFLFMQYKKVIS